MRHLLPLLLCCLCTIATAGESTAWPMRWRTWCDSDSGISFRHPYLWLPRQMHDWSLDRERTGGGGTRTTEIKEVVVNGRKMRVAAPAGANKATDLTNDLIIFSEVAEGAPDAVGDRFAKLPLQWGDWDYYRADPARPHAEAKFAAKGISARLGVANDRCALAVRHGDRISGLVFAGPVDRDLTRQVMDTFEILAATGKQKKASRITWRDSQFRAGKVIDAQGKAIAPQGKAKPVPWSQGWEIETEHYHVTGHTSPARLLQHGAYLEALYATYSDLYDPDKMPPQKFEVHIFDLYTDFQGGAAASGIPVGGGSGITGGFFVPRLLSLWVYEEAGKLGGADFTVEHVTAHECSHQFLHLACNGSSHVPTWFNEGLAVYFESGEFRNGSFQIKSPRERISRLQSQYGQAGRMLVQPDWYLDHHGHIDASQYAEVYAMVHFWVFGTCKGEGCRHKECGRTRFKTYWQALRGGEDGTEAFQRIFLDDMVKAKGSKEAALKAWHDAMVAYVKKLK
jgi:hypothetical protein